MTATGGYKYDAGEEPATIAVEGRASRGACTGTGTDEEGDRSEILRGGGSDRVGGDLWEGFFPVTPALYIRLMCCCCVPYP